jgi:hypothetical protein
LSAANPENGRMTIAGSVYAVIINPIRESATSRVFAIVGSAGEIIETPVTERKLVSARSTNTLSYRRSCAFAFHSPISIGRRVPT